jgi:D-tyrosyl-tRNA(Tyr) deacylase
MRAVVQVVLSASVSVNKVVVALIDRPGLVILVGVTHSDTELEAHRLADKIWDLRILDGEKSASDTDAPLLVVSQFTLYGETSKGRRPSWSAAAPGHQAEPLIEVLCGALRANGADVATGVFGADMRLSLVNDGPRTLILDT